MATPVTQKDDWRKETEAAPIRRYSSSSYDDLFRHKLYTCKSRMGDICGVKKLCLHDLQISPSCNESSIGMNVRNGAANEDRYAGEYVRSLVPSNAKNLSLSVSVDQEWELRDLQPFMKSVVNRPDVVLLKDKLPLLIVEVQSSPYSNSLSKTVVDLIDQLRLLRNYKCTGFTFPDFSHKVCVTKVEVEWKDLSFCSTFTPLTSSNAVKTEVSLAISNSLQVCSGIGSVQSAPFFIPFSPIDLAEVGDKVSDRIERQVYSRQTVVLEGEQYFWKYNPDLIE